MIARNHGHNINVLSSGAISGNAFTSSYSSSNAALLSKVSIRPLRRRSVSFVFTDFTETLSQELILVKTTGVRTAAILPFYLDGGIHTTLRKQ